MANGETNTGGGFSFVDTLLQALPFAAATAPLVFGSKYIPGANLAINAAYAANQARQGIAARKSVAAKAALAADELERQEQTDRDLRSSISGFFPVGSAEAKAADALQGTALADLAAKLIKQATGLPAPTPGEPPRDFLGEIDKNVETREGLLTGIKQEELAYRQWPAPFIEDRRPSFDGVLPPGQFFQPDTPISRLDDPRLLESEGGVLTPGQFFQPDPTISRLDDPRLLEPEVGMTLFERKQAQERAQRAQVKGVMDQYMGGGEFRPGPVKIDPKGGLTRQLIPQFETVAGKRFFEAVGNRIGEMPVGGIFIGGLGRFKNEIAQRYGVNPSELDGPMRAIVLQQVDVERERIQTKQSESRLDQLDRLQGIELTKAAVARVGERFGSQAGIIAQEALGLVPPAQATTAAQTPREQADQAAAAREAELLLAQDVAGSKQAGRQRAKLGLDPAGGPVTGNPEKVGKLVYFARKFITLLTAAETLGNITLADKLKTALIDVPMARLRETGDIKDQAIGELRDAGFQSQVIIKAFDAVGNPSEREGIDMKAILTDPAATVYKQRRQYLNFLDRAVTSLEAIDPNNVNLRDFRSAQARFATPFEERTSLDPGASNLYDEAVQGISNTLTGAWKSIFQGEAETSQGASQEEVIDLNQ